MDGKDGHGLKLDKVEPTFSSYNLWYASKNHQTKCCS